MDPFLGRSAFSGPSADVATFRGPFVGEACFNGCIAFTIWRRDEVERLLPPGLELAANTSSTPDLHPLVFVFGEQTEGALIFSGFTLPTGINYWEFAMAVPFVKHPRRADLHTYVPRMYSSYFPATWNGNVHYGFSKQMAKMCWRGRLFLLTAEDDRLLFHAAVEPAGSWYRGTAGDLQNFAALREVFTLPIVGRKADGRLVSSYFGWDFGEALVRSSASWVSVDAPLVANLPPRCCHVASSGTFEVRGMIWRLSWPSPCRF